MGLLWLYLSFPLFRLVSENLGRWVWACTLKGFHKNWLESLAKRRLCLGPASVTNCTPPSALSFRVSLFPGTRGHNITISDTEHLFKYLMAMCMPSSWNVHWDLCPISYWVFLFFDIELLELSVCFGDEFFVGIIVLKYIYFLFWVLSFPLI